MHRLPILFTILITILFTQFLLAYTAVFKSGKSVEGDLISEDDRHLQLRDRMTGVVMTIKKNQLDHESTRARNANNAESNSSPDQQTVVWQMPRKSIVDIARETRQSRTGASRTFTQNDLDDAPQLSIFGDELEEAESRPTKTESTPLSESRWRKEAEAYRKEISRLEEKNVLMAALCEKAILNRKTFQSLLREPSECIHSKEIEKQLQDAKRRYEDFQDRARRSEVPYDWIE